MGHSKGEDARENASHLVCIGFNVAARFPNVHFMKDLLTLALDNKVTVLSGNVGAHEGT